MLRGGAMRLGGAVLVVPSPRWCRSAPPLACLLGSGSPGTWLRRARGASSRAAQGPPMGGCTAAVRAGPKAPIPRPAAHLGGARQGCAQRRV